MRTKRIKRALKSDDSEAALASVVAKLKTFALPSCCPKLFLGKMKGVHVAPQSEASSQDAERCTHLARTQLMKVVRFLVETTCNVGGVDRVRGRFDCPCATVIYFDTADASRATTTVELIAITQPPLTFAASIHFAHLKAALWKLNACPEIKYSVEIEYQKYCFTLEPPREGPGLCQNDWASSERANEAASLRRPAFTVQQQLEVQLRRAQEDLRRSEGEREALELVIATQKGQRLGERPCAQPLDEPAIQVPTVVPVTVTPPVWQHLDESPGFPAWQQPAPHVPQHPNRATGTQPGIALPSFETRLATWGGVHPANNAMNHSEPWILGPSMPVAPEAPVIDESPCQLGHTLRPGPASPVPADPGAATTLTKHDVRLKGSGLQVGSRERLKTAQMALLSTRLDENSSWETPCPSLNAKIISDLQQKTVSCVPFHAENGS
jgi:hypothetical protein